MSNGEQQPYYGEQEKIDNGDERRVFDHVAVSEELSSGVEVELQ